MKRAFIVAAFLMAGFFLNQVVAQSPEDDIQIIQGAWGKQKRELVRIGMELSEKDSVKFWPVYDKYEEARKKLGRDRLKILDDYITHYETLTPVKTDEIVARLFKNETGYNTLLQQYYANMKKALNSLQAAKFLHIESFLQSYIKFQLQGNVPFIGELEKLKQ